MGVVCASGACARSSNVVCLFQILSEEKGRVDAMAEGLEEESKKALQMEAELEKHLAQFDTERQQLRAALSREEKK